MKNRQLITASLSVMFLLAAGVSSSRFLWATEEQPTQPVEAPPQRIPLGLYNDFTLQNAIPVYYWYRDDSQERKNPIIFTKEEVNTNLEKIAKRESHYFGSPDLHLYQACEKYKDDIHSSFFHKKKVAIIGSSTSWYESVVLSYGGSPTTISPYKITNEDARIHVLTPEEYAKNPQQFDAVIAVGSIQNTGLGRYGDAINPNADCLAMEQFQSMLKDDGLLFLSIPVGKDCIWWNVHRIYGRQRFPLLTKGWDLIDSFGFQDADLDCDRGIQASTYQPVFVLKKPQAKYEAKINQGL